MLKTLSKMAFQTNFKPAIAFGALTGKHSALACVLGAALAFGGSTVKAETTIIVGGNTEPLIIAQYLGWFDEADIKIEVVDIPNFMQYPSMLASGAIDVLDSYMPANMWNMVLAGADFKVISGSALAVAARDGKPSRNVRGYFVRKDLYDSGEITKIPDFAGYRLADFAPVPPKGKLSPFPVGHKVFGEVFREIDWVRMGQSDILAALDAGTIAGGRMQTRWVKIAVDKGLAVEIAKETDFVPIIQVRGMVAKEAFLTENREAMIAFLGIYKRAQAYAIEVQNGQHQEEYMAAVAAYSKIPADIALELIQELEITTEIATDDLMVTQEHFVMVGAQEAVVPLDTVLDFSYLEAAQ